MPKLIAKTLDKIKKQREPLDELEKLRNEQKEELQRVKQEREQEKKKLERQRIRSLRRSRRFGSFDEDFNQTQDKLG